MEIPLIQGNIIEQFIEGDYKYLLHQANCKNAAGGLAGTIFRQLGCRAKAYVNCYGMAQAQRVKGIDKEKYVVHLFGQFNTGTCTEYGLDCYEMRIGALQSSLKHFQTIYWHDEEPIIIPLLASGLGADLGRKDQLSDQDYFKSFVWPSYLQDLKKYTTVCTLSAP